MASPHTEEDEFEEEDEGPSPLVRLSSAAWELVSALGQVSTAAGRAVLLAVGREANTRVYSNLYKRRKVDAMRRVRQQMIEARRMATEENASLKKVDLLERQLAELQADFARMMNNVQTGGNEFCTPSSTPQPPNTGPHHNPEPVVSECDLDFLESALDMIVSQQEQLPAPTTPPVTPQAPCFKGKGGKGKGKGKGKGLTPTSNLPKHVNSETPVRSPLPFSGNELLLQKKKLADTSSKTPAREEQPLSSLSNLTPECLLGQKGRLRPPAQPRPQSTPSKAPLNLQDELNLRFKAVRTQRSPSPAWASYDSE